MKMRFYYLLLVNSMISHYILYTSSNLIENLYNGAISSIFIALGISIFNCYIMIYVFNYFKNLTLVDINKILFGNIIGNFLSIVYILMNMILSLFMFRDLLQFVSLFMLPSTSVAFTGILLLIPLYVNLCNNTRSYLRFSALLTLIVAFYLLLNFLLSFKEIDYNYIRGVVPHSSIVPNLSLVGTSAYFFSGLSHIALFNPLFKKFSFKKTSLLFGTLGTAIGLVSIVIPTGIWGPVAVQQSQFTVISSADNLSVDLFFMQRVLFILLPGFFLMDASQFLSYGFVGYNLFKILIPNLKISLVMISIFALLFIVFSKLMQGSSYILTLANLALSVSFYFYTALSILLFIFTKLKEKKVP